MINYQNIINEADQDGKFNNAKELSDFLDSYLPENATIDDIKDQEDNIAEYVDGLCPIYYYDIVKQWQENPDYHQMTIDVCGEYQEKDIYKMMTSDLYFYYDQQLRSDYNQLIDLLEEEETNA